jgi:hypothetical protein
VKNMQAEAQNTVIRIYRHLYNSGYERRNEKIIFSINQNVININNVIYIFRDYRLIVQRSFARPIDPESYAGGSVSSW